VRTFATLSPLPGFLPGYLRPILAGERTGFALTRDALFERFPRRSRQEIVARRGAGDDFGRALLALLDDPSWPHDAALVRCLREPLTALAYDYVAHEQDRRGRPLNPVANFHLGNGATVRQGDVNVPADLRRAACAVVHADGQLRLLVDLVPRRRRDRRR
jgi:malonyl-CoA decarboxylase